MRKIVLPILILFLLFFGASAYALFVHTPKIVAQKMVQTANDLGIRAGALQNPQIHYDRLIYENIALDEEAFSTIKALHVKYDPLKILTSQKIDTIEIRGLNLTGTLRDDQTIDINGWNGGSIGQLAQKFNARKINISKARLSLLTPQFGGLSFDCDLELKRIKNIMEFQGRLSTVQSKLSFAANISGTATAHGHWQSTLEIENAKFVSSNAKAARLGGMIKLSQNEGAPLNILSEFQSGNLSFGGLAWQNASGGFEGTQHEYKLFINAQSIGTKGLELSLSIDTGQNPPVSGSIHAPNFKQLLSYFQNQGLLPEKDAISEKFSTLENIETTFELHKNQGKKILNYNIKNKEESIDLNGKIDIENKKLFAGNFTTAPTFLNTIDSATFPNGQINLTGNFRHEENNFTSAITANIESATYKIAPFSLNNISGDLTLNAPLTLSTKTAQPLSCTLPIKTKHSCTLALQITNGALNFTTLNTQIFGGTINSKNLNPLKNKENWTFNLQNINLFPLAEALNFSDVSATGTLKGTIPIIKEKDRLFIRNAILKNQTRGTLRYLYKTTPDFFEGDELELETIAMALKNYHYDDFEIRLNGPVDGDINALIIASGKNPDLFGARKISLHLKTKLKVENFLKNLIAQN